MPTLIPTTSVDVRITRGVSPLSSLLFLYSFYFLGPNFIHLPSPNESFSALLSGAYCTDPARFPHCPPLSNFSSEILCRADSSSALKCKRLHPTDVA